MSRIAVLEGGRSFERQVSLRSGARVTDALERLGHEVIGIDAGPDLVDALRGAYTDGRGGSEMRLNYSGSDEERISEGVRRIGRVVSEQVELYGTLTGAPAAAPPAEDAPGSGRFADVLPLSRRQAG